MPLIPALTVWNGSLARESFALHRFDSLVNECGLSLQEASVTLQQLHLLMACLLVDRLQRVRQRLPSVVHRSVQRMLDLGRRLGEFPLQRPLRAFDELLGALDAIV